MHVDPGFKVINVQAIGDAYAIAANYLRQSGSISNSFATDERLLEMIVGLFDRGEHNRLKLANRAIDMFEAAALTLDIEPNEPRHG